jgi:hypothetical protein
VRNYFFNWYWGGGGGVQLRPLGTASTNRPIVPAPGDYDDGEIGGMMIGKKNRSTRRKPAPVSLCPPQIPQAFPDANPGRCGRNPATNRLGYDTGRGEKLWLDLCSTIIESSIVKQKKMYTPKKSRRTLVRLSRHIFGGLRTFLER